MFDTLDSIVVRLTARVGRSFVVVILLVILLVATAFYVRPATSTTALGVQYAALARDPWAGFRGPLEGFPPSINVGHRLLTPAISYFLGLRGERIIVTNLLAAAALLGCAFAWFRRHAPRPGDALFASSVLAFSLVTLTTIYYGGYCDSTTYLLVFLMYLARAKPAVFYSLLLLGMLNHEEVAFLIPWFLYVTRASYRNRGRWVLCSAAGVVTVLSLYGGYRSLMAAHGAAGPVGAYLDPLRADPWRWLRRSTPYQGLGLWSVFKLLWAIPCVVVVSMWRRGRRADAVEIVLPVICAAFQFLVAYDSSRLFTLGFMSMVLSLAFAFRENPYGFRRWAVPIFLVNLLIPEVFTAAKAVEVMVPTAVRVIQRL